MAISPADVKKMREATGLGMMECKKALEEAGGDQEKAVELLRKKGLQTAEKRTGRATANGLVRSYIHHNHRVGVLVQVNCETDFVARNEDFGKFVADLCMHIAAFSPLSVSRDQVDPKVVATERDIAREQVKDKPAAIQDKIVEGKLDKFFAERVLLEQPWVHDDKQSVEQILKGLIGKIGENMRIVRFARFDISETPEA
ncbi:MAG TPA: translation elongation factor Ts [Phycisphaerae bacterium]|nr:translation elongation factor Ts [Phycisphaerae bacterium]HOI54038.1 translation elongation factor Ts [Phycisphaerae bacterium]